MVLHGRFFTPGLPRNVARGGAIAAGLLLLSVVVTACGKRGPPLAPLRLVPEAPAEAALHRTEGKAVLTFALPKKNLNGPGAVELDRVEIYAVTAAPGVAAPRDRDLLDRKYLVGTIPVKPPPAEDETPQTKTPEEQAAEAKAAADTRPSAGDVVKFSEDLTPDKTTPTLLPVEPKKPSGKTPAVTPSAQPSAPPPVTYAVRIYGVRGLTKSGHPGAPAPRLLLPLVPLPQPPADAIATFDEKGVLIAWMPPLVDEPPLTELLPAVPSAAVIPAPLADDEASLASTMALLASLPAVPLSDVIASPLLPPRPAAAAAAAAPKIAAPLAFTFNVYEAAAEAPLNPSALATQSFRHAGAPAGQQQCFALRTVKTVAAVGIEGPPSAPVCLTPRDIFPPAAPTGLNAVAGPGAINLIWNANAEPDLAGYLVLRGEVPGDTLQPLTPSPIRDTNYRDATVKPGVRYVYVVVAADTATPPNTSARTARVEETAR